MPEVKKEKRSAEKTREKILLAAFKETHWRGFQGLRVDAVLAMTGLTKGAFYHHFVSKQALGYALVDEVIATKIKSIWIDTLENNIDPLTAIEEAMIKAVETFDPDILTRGCPLNNLAQEMSPIDEGFRIRISRVFEMWHNAIEAALDRGKTNGYIDRKVDSSEAADFIIASIEGCIGYAKNKRDPASLLACIAQMDRYLNTLRPALPATA